MLSVLEPVATKKRDPYEKRAATKCCPRCNSEMVYKKIFGTHRIWSPVPYSWRCKNCSNIYFIDGPLDPEEEAWHNDYKARQRNFMYAMIHKIEFGKDAPPKKIDIFEDVFEDIHEEEYEEEKDEEGDA